MNYYIVNITTYHKGKEIGTNILHIITDEIKENYIQHLTWDNVTQEYRTRCYRFTVWNLKKGRLVEFFPSFGRHKRVKEWKDKDLDITVEWNYRLDNPPIQKILDYPNGEKAIQYLIERWVEKQ